MATHYVPALAEPNGRQRRAVCGAWTTLREHTNEPTCPECAAWLTEERADERTADDVFGEAPVSYLDRDPITGRPWEGY